MGEHSFTLLLVQLRGIDARQADVERRFDDHFELGSGRNLLLPVEHQQRLDPLHQFPGGLLRCEPILTPAGVHHKDSIRLACSSFALILALHPPPGVLAPEGGA